MDLEEDKDLFYIAKQGLKASLPAGWMAFKTPEGNLYYHNTNTFETSWEHPCIENFKASYQAEKKKKIERLAV